LAYLKVKLRRRSNKFIPDADGEFAFTAQHFARQLAKDPSRYHLPPEDVAEIVRAVEAYRAAVAANILPYTKSKKTSMEKDAARAVAERLVREAGNLIRANRHIDAITKSLLRIGTRPKRLRRHGAPVTAPALTFVGPVPFTSTVDGKHVIKFRDPLGRVGSKAKPAGVERLELYVDLVPFGEPIPTWPGERWGGRTWYLRSFKRSPMTVAYPKCNEPMRVVYWACWANATGERGPYSPTLATRVEGIDHALPAGIEPRQLGQRPHHPHGQTVIITSGHRQLPDLVDVNRIDESRLLTDESSEAA
jgi:hypothetical protein